MEDNKILIYGTAIRMPEAPPIEQIDGFALPKSEQYWKRKELPDFFDKVVYDKDKNLILTEAQEDYARQEVNRCKNGYWFMNNGQATYITWKYYFYLQWWKLEDDIYPFYRDTDRRYFLYLNHWEKTQWCLGVIRGKKRREGASSQACSNLVYEAIFFKNSNCGLVSKTKDDSRDTFTDMVMFGYRQLPVFLKPKQLSKDDTVSELILAHKSTSEKEQEAVIKEDGAHRSKINYRAPVLNAYDRGRMSRILADEFGKLAKEVPASKLFSIISKTLIKGVKRVGFIEMPSTVNSLTTGTGGEFKSIWKKADHFKKRPTTNRLVRYFTPAYDGYEGFIDKYGFSVIDKPTQDQYEYLVKRWVVRDEDGELSSELSEEDIQLGAKVYVTKKRRQDLTGEDLEEEIRMNPCDEDEMFMSANSNCAFNLMNIVKREKELEANPITYRYVKFYRTVETQKIKLQDLGTEEVSQFCWKMTYILNETQSNKFYFFNGSKCPDNVKHGVITVDSYSNTQGGRKYGSKAAAWIGIRPDALDPHNTGKVVGLLYGRPATKDELHGQVMMAAEYHGYKVWYEHTADDYLGYFRDRGKVMYLGSYPLSMIDPNKRDKAELYKGTPITPFALTKQLDDGIHYFENYCDRIDYIELLEVAKVFEPHNRTEYDMMVSFLMNVSLMQEPIREQPKPETSIVKEYPRALLAT